MENYRFVCKRGEGTFAEVWEVENQKTGEHAALKVLKKSFKSVSEVCEDIEFRVLKLFSARKPCCVSTTSTPNTPNDGIGTSPGIKRHDTHHPHHHNNNTDRNSQDDNNHRSQPLEKMKQLETIHSDTPFNPQITGLHDAFFEPNQGKVVFVLELLGQSLLEEIMERKRARSRLQQRLRAAMSPPPLERDLDSISLFHEGELRIILFQILSGIQHMHSRGIFHRDIKPENILFRKEERTKPIDAVTKTYSHGHREDWHVADWVGPAGTSTLRLKLADFGSSQFMTDYNKSRPRRADKSQTDANRKKQQTTNRSIAAYTEYIATRWYRSPECLLTSGNYGPPMDVWAAGCVAVELLTGQPFFPGENENHQLELIHAMYGSPKKDEVEKLIGPVGVHITASMFNDNYETCTPNTDRTTSTDNGFETESESALLPASSSTRSEKWASPANTASDLENENPRISQISTHYDATNAHLGCSDSRKGSANSSYDGSVSTAPATNSDAEDDNTAGCAKRLSGGSPTAKATFLPMSPAETTAVHKLPTTPGPSHPRARHWRREVRPNILGGSISDSLSDLLHRLLAYYPVERITAEDALRHSFFSDMRL